MNTITIVVGGLLVLLLAIFMIRLSYNITINLINGRKFHHELEKDFSKLRLNKMLSALGLSKTQYLYQTNVRDIHQQMKRCTDCTSTNECDEKLATPDVDMTEIDFCNNEENLKKIKRLQSTRS
jgi:5-bromo-4-chloroindolyl phosphate hydrolysis protein